MRSTWPMARRRPSSGLSAPIAVAPGDRLVLRRGAGADRIVGGAGHRCRAGPGRLASPPDGRTGRAPGGRGRRGRYALAARAAPARPARRPRRRGRPVAAPSPLRTWSRAAESAILPRGRRRGMPSTMSGRRPPGRSGARRRSTGRRPLRSGSELIDGLVAGRPAGPRRRPRSDRPARAQHRPRRIRTWRPRWIASEAALAVAAPPPLAAAARAAGCPADGIRELERSGRIVVLEPDLAYAATTYGELDATARWRSPRPSR